MRPPETALSDRPRRQNVAARMRDLSVAAHQITIRAGVYDVADWAIGNLLDRSNHAAGFVGRPRIDQDRTVFSGL